MVPVITVTSVSSSVSHDESEVMQSATDSNSKILFMVNKFWGHLPQRST